MGDAASRQRAEDAGFDVDEVRERLIGCCSRFGPEEDGRSEARNIMLRVVSAVWPRRRANAPSPRWGGGGGAAAAASPVPAAGRRVAVDAAGSSGDLSSRSVDGSTDPSAAPLPSARYYTTPLHWAAALDDVEAIAEIAAVMPRGEWGDVGSHSPLAVAASRGHVGAMKALVAVGCNAQNGDALNASLAFVPAARFLLASGAVATQQHAISAARRMHIRALEFLLDEASLGVTPAEATGLLVHAATGRGLRFAYARSPSKAAADFLGVARFLAARHGASVELAHNAGKSLVILAAERGLTDVAAAVAAEHCLSAGPEARADRRTPLHFMAGSAGPDAFDETAAAFGLDPRAPDLAGWTPLHEAARASNGALVRHLLGRHGCDPAVATLDTGETPLHLGLWHDDALSIVQLLVAAGPGDALSRKSRAGHTPIDTARRLGANGVLDYFRGRHAVQLQRAELERVLYDPANNIIGVRAVVHVIGSYIHAGKRPHPAAVTRVRRAAATRSGSAAKRRPRTTSAGGGGAQ